MRRREELSVHDGCLLWGSQVVVPPQGRTKIIKELHEGHPGSTRMKALARSFVWWPQLDRDLENVIQSCEICQTYRHLPPMAPLQPWEWPQRPWARVHIDYAGPLFGQQFLILVNTHSKWIEIKSVTNPTSVATIEHLCSIFATHGLPEMLVSDNGSVFISSEFEDFTSTKLKSHHDQKTKEMTFQTGDTVSVCNFPGDTWIQGIIDKPSGPLSYYVKLQDGRVIHRHIDHILACPTNSPEISQPSRDWTGLPDITQESSTTAASQQVIPEMLPILRRSSRPSVPPKRFGQDSTT